MDICVGVPVGKGCGVSLANLHSPFAPQHVTRLEALT